MELDGLPSTVMPPSAATLTFDLLTPKANQHIYEPKYICDQNWVKLTLTPVYRGKYVWTEQQHSYTYSLNICRPGLQQYNIIQVGSLFSWR